MKKLLLIFASLLIIPLSVFASNPNVLTLITEVNQNTINFEGTIDEGSHAVMCKLYDSENKEIDMLSVSVINHGFEGSFIALSTGDYTVACADYDGGNIKSQEVTIEVEPTTYTVSFNSNGGTEYDPVEVLDGGKVSKPNPDPTKGDKVFGGWFEDDTYAREFDFNTPITEDIELFALWTDPVIVRVDFDTRCESSIEPVEIIAGETVSRPDPDPTNGDKIFGGWFEDDTFTKEFDFNTPITNDIVLFALWTDPEVETEKYTVKDKNENIVTFTEEEGHTYTLIITDYLSYTKEEVISLAGITEKEYDDVFSAVRKAVKDEGTLISLYDIIIVDENEKEITEGPITIKIKLTEEMKKYKQLKLIYVNDEFTIENPIKLTIDGDYAVGVLPHLSMYTLVGTNETSNEGTSIANNPKTNDNIYTWYTLFAISIIGLVVGTYTVKKLKRL